MTGRDAELQQGVYQLEGIEGGPSSVLVTGEAGVGKTTVWETMVAEGRDRGFRVLCARGAETESVLAFGGLTDLLVTVSDGELDVLPAPQRSALRAALLREASNKRRHDRRAVSAGVLTLIRDLSTRTPVLLAVDDLQWLDAPSARVVEYVARRLSVEPVAIVASQREDSGTPVAVRPGAHRDRVTTLALAPLAPQATEALVAAVCAESGHWLTMRRRRRLAALAAGNPLFACELAREAVRGDGEQLPTTLRQLVEERIQALPAGTRELLLVAATLREPTVPLVAAASGGAVDEVNVSLEEAREAGVLEPARDLSTIAFRHPLYRAGVYASATAALRRSAHRRAASAVSDTEEEVGHLALAATRPDSQLAARLDAAARRALARGAPETATDLAGHALRLTPPSDGSDAYRRAVTVAEFAFHAGEIDQARQSLETLVEEPAPPLLRARALQALGELESHQDSHIAAIARFTAALELDPSPDVAGQLYAHLAYSTVSGGDFGGSRHHALAGLALVEGVRSPSLRASLYAVAAIADNLSGGPVNEDFVRRAVIGEDLNAPLMMALRPSLIVGHLRLYAGRLTESIESLSRARAAAVASGNESDLVSVSISLSWAHCWRGDLAVARAYADESLIVADRLDSEPGRCIAAAYGAVPQAFTGNLARAQELAREALELADTTGFGTGRLWASWALIVTALECGEPAMATPIVEALLALIDEHGLPTPVRVMALADALEVLLELGHVERAERYVSILEESATRTGIAWAQMQAERCGALCRAAVGDLDGAWLRISEALRFIEKHELAIESGRTLLVAGQIARRRRQRRQARSHVEAALEIFATSGARTWIALAEAELARTVPRSVETGQLTATEARVARLAGSGLTNRAVAARLNISPKTVEANLARVYRKLGINSRAQLGATIAHTQPGAREDPLG